MKNISSTIQNIRKIMWQDIGLNGDAQRLEQLGWMLFLKIFCDKDKELAILDSNYKSPIPYQFQWDNWAKNDEGLTGDDLLYFVDQQLFPALRNIKVSSDNKRALIVRDIFEGNHNYMKSGGNLRKVLNKFNEIDFNNSKDKHNFGDIYESLLKDLQSAGKSGEFYTPRAITHFVTQMVDPKIDEIILDPACGTGGYLTAAIEHLNPSNTSIETLSHLSNNIRGWEYKPLPYLLAITNLILHDIEVPNLTFRDSLDTPLIEYKEKDRVDVILANPPFGGIVANNNETNFKKEFQTKESADLFLILMIHLLKVGGRAGIVLPDGSLTGEGVKKRVREKLLRDCNLHTIIRLPNSVFQPYATVATNLLFFDKVDHNRENGFSTEKIWFYEHRLSEGQKAYSKTKPIKLSEFEPIKQWWHNRTESKVSWCVDIEEITKRNFDLDIKNPHQQQQEQVYSSSELLNQLEQSFAQTQQILNELKEQVKQ